MFIINKWYFVISCDIINLMSTKYILLTAELLFMCGRIRKRNGG